ncbi:MAG: alkaline shock response membrane anchor protein AmaP [bacterium]
MNLLYRMVIFIMAIIFMFVSILLTFYAVGLADYDFFADILYQVYERWEFAILFLLLFAASVWVVYPIVANDIKTTVISKSELGEIDISIDALDTLVNNIALEQEGVVAIKNRLSTKEDKLMIDLTAKIFPSKNIPEITTNLQTLVKSYIEDITGVTVGEVKILVDTVTANGIEKE